MDHRRDNLILDKDQIKKVAAATGCTKEQVDEIYRAIFKVIGDYVMKGKTVQVKDFGTFRLKHLHRRAMEVQDIVNWEKVSPEHFKITFMANADLRRRADRKLLRQKKKEALAEKEALLNEI